MAERPDLERMRTNLSVDGGIRPGQARMISGAWRQDVLALCDYVISLERAAGEIRVLPCACDPIFSGEEFCNGGCDLTARLAQAERERDEAQTEITRLQGVCAERHDALLLSGCDQIELLQLRHQLGVAREALVAFGQHRGTCPRDPYAQRNDASCNCGFDAALAATARAEGEG